MGNPTAVIDWILTTECNMTCPYCLMGKHKKSTEVSAVDLRFIETISGTNIFLFHLTGGEPFIVKNFPDICCRLQQKGHWVSVNTNLVCSPSSFVEKVDPSRVAYVNCSLHYWLRKEHMAPFRRHFEALSSAGFFAFITLVADPLCFDEIYEFVIKECKDLPVYLKLMRGVCHGQSYPAGYTVWQQACISQVAQHTASQLSRRNPEHFDMLLRYGMSIDDFRMGIIPEADAICIDGHHYLRITETGDIEGCQGAVLGNIAQGIVRQSSFECLYRTAVSECKHLCASHYEKGRSGASD